MINEQDFVPRLPLSKWGFDLYGTTRKKTMTNDDINIFNKRAGEYSALSDDNMKALVKELGNVAATRADCFKYTCKCHSISGKQDGKSITNTLRYKGKYEADYGLESYKKIISKEQLSACKLEILPGKLGGWKFTNCQSPMFFMYTLADAMNGLLDSGKFLIFNVAKKYENAKLLLVLYSLKINKPHFVDTYVILTGRKGK